MIDIALRQTEYLSATNAQAPTEVYLFVMCKETSVESASLPIVFRANHQGCTCSPKYLGGIIVLTVIVLNGVKNASPAEGIAEAVEVSPTRPCIFKAVLVENGEQLGLAGCHLGVNIHKLDERGEPMVSDLNIAIEQQIVFGINLLQSLVIPLGKAPVLLKSDDLTLGECCGKQRQGIVGRGIVCHKDGGFVARILQDGGQILMEHLLSVPIQYDNSKFHLMDN